MTKIPIKTKLQAINEYLSGYGGYIVIARKFDMQPKELRVMVAAYRVHGTDIFFNRPVVTGPFRVELVEWHLANNSSIVQTAAHFGYLGTAQIRQWIKTYSQTGQNGLLSIQKGRPSLMMREKNTKPQKALTSEEENILLKQKILKQQIEIDALKLLASMEQRDQRIRDSRK